MYSPIDGNAIASVAIDDPESVRRKVEAAERAYSQWRCVPAPRRGELIRLFGEELRRHKDALGALVTLETGKIHAEGLGEVQEMIDICDFAVGLSRQLYGLTMPSERPGHRMAELWHPMGVVGVISAFNFPVAVWSWNTALALVCGNIVKTETFAPILYVIPYSEFDEALALHNDVPQGLSSCVFTRNLLEAEEFLSAQGSDCGIANVNIGPSGAEIGGAFGGEKETGGGRESGSDAWKGYMRRCTATVNYSSDLPLAQGIEFGTGSAGARLS